MNRGELRQRIDYRLDRSRLWRRIEVWFDLLRFAWFAWRDPDGFQEMVTDLAAAFSDFGDALNAGPSTSHRECP